MLNGTEPKTAEERLLLRYEFTHESAVVGMECRGDIEVRGYCSHSSLTLAVELRKNVIQEMNSASQSEFTCKIFALQKLCVAENGVNSKGI